EIDSAIASESPMILRLDLSSLSFCDSSGLGFIMGRYRRMEEIGGTLTLVDPAMPIMRILRLSGLDKLIRTETSKGVK
ncbi:MAG: STAS domain-containing protein, partial [Eubacteriales bacterium]